ncbi:MAG: ribbon-helix-helix protein, CopG family [Gemmatimonadaceae bacterium]|nr:ribbon-helix-helix protein, CopG family [Gemmatimonadaceae bacterium]
MRTIIDIPPHILSEIDALAKKEKISRAEAVRRAMTEYLEKRPRSRPHAAFGIWKSRKIDPLAYEDALRGEWNR